MKKIALVVVLLFAFSSVCLAENYLVKWKGQPPKHSAIQKVYRNILNGQLTKMRLTEEQAEVIMDRDDVEYVEEDEMVHIVLTPNDEFYSSLWGMTMISMPEAWDISTGSNDVIIAVTDTGINYSHPDLAANVWTNPGEIAGNGIDDDGNGYIDDVHGINSITGSGDPFDDHSHGSHCSGTIGGVGNNSIGVVGVNWNVKIIGCKFLNAGGSGYNSDAVECLDYFQWLKDHGTNVMISSNSWGGGSFMTALHDAICNLDALFVAAAGNSGMDTDVTPFFPSSYDCANLLSVAATDSSDAKASFSNYGLTSVDMGAPGVNILSTVLNEGYASYSGTSMATPHVAGAAALLLSKANHSVADLKYLLMEYGDPNEALAGKTVSGKRLNVFSSLGGEEPPPPFCGDGICDPDESCETCPGDCGECPPPPINQPPIADFSYYAFKRQIRFTNLSSDLDGSIVSYFWDFGDGKTSGARNAKHHYKKIGDYSVTLTVTDDKGATGTITKNITVSKNEGRSCVCP